ncbi:MAG TPA: galactokinase [Chthonomonadaceae bacterium]|nr:galactokinase [Chthonomonadaceae bacterium]
MAMDTPSPKINEIERRFMELYGSAPTIVVRAPGRVNLIGEHTDYNDGFVFPAAIDRDVLIAASPRPDRQVRAFALNFNQSSTFSLQGVQPATDGRERWSNYLRAMAWIFQEEGMSPQGMNCVVLGDVPLGAGLSSSAAMLVASGLAFAAGLGIEVEGVRLALLAQKAEQQFVGVNVGIMDQFISALGQKDHALLIDTRALTYEAVPLPQSGVSIVIADTNKKRGLVDSEYNTRRAECERAVEILQQFLPGITALRDVSLAEFEQYADRLPEVICRRARHVISEDDRTLRSVTALKAGDIARFGELMNASHESLKNDYQVSCKELDAMVAAARAIEGVYGARMTGAGFGGCTVSLVRTEAVETFLREVPPRYKQATGLNATIYATTASQGAQRIK